MRDISRRPCRLLPAVLDLRFATDTAAIRDGGHALTAFDWKHYLDHADTLLKKEGR